MRILTKSQAKTLDKIAMDNFSIPGTTLMGNAGEQITNHIESILSGISSPKIGIVCGKGSNGGDGFSAGDLLHNLGFNITIYALMEPADIVGDSRVFHDRCVKNNISIFYSKSVPESKPNFDLMVDSIIGTGCEGELRSGLRPWVSWLNENPVTLSVDIPTGVSATTGRVAQYAVKANFTITMGSVKLGMALEPGKSYCGKIYSADIGFPSIEDNLDGRSYNLIEEKHIQSLIDPLAKTTHKYLQGKVLVLAGSSGMTGAAYLTSMAALRSGAGLVISFAPESLHNIYELKITEGMTIPCADKGKGYFALENFNTIMDRVDWCDVMVLGPGLGNNHETSLLVEQLVKHVKKPLVIDADGLRPFYKKLSQFSPYMNKAVLTPHIGELSNLIGKPSDEVSNDLPAAVETLMDDFPGILLAKFSPSLVAWQSKGYVNSTGNPGLATAGSGDVLSGMIASFIAQGMDPLNATNIGMYLHGKAGDQLASKLSQRGLISSDILNQIVTLLSDYES